MKEEILRSEAGDESIRNVTIRSWVRIVSQETRKCLSVLHLGDTPAFQFLLTKESRDLSLIDYSTFSSGINHNRNVILGEFLY